MNSIAPQDIWRSEAFAEDLFQESAFAPPATRDTPRFGALSSTVLCAVPVLVALLGGAVAFLHTMG
jgi:hypothetical protein